MKNIFAYLLLAGMLAGLTGCFGGPDKKEIRLENERSSGGGVQIR